jgi:hypothetical protein
MILSKTEKGLPSFHPSLARFGFCVPGAGFSMGFLQVRVLSPYRSGADKVYNKSTSLRPIRQLPYPFGHLRLKLMTRGREAQRVAPAVLDTSATSERTKISDCPNHWIECKADTGALFQLYP